MLSSPSELLETYRRKPNPKNRVGSKTESAVTQYAIDFPAHGQVRVSNELRKQGVFVSPSGVRSIWLRHDLANFKARLRALEAKVAEEGLILSEAGFSFAYDVQESTAPKISQSTKIAKKSSKSWRKKGSHFQPLTREQQEISRNAVNDPFLKE